MSEALPAKANRLLASLPAEDLQKLQQHLEHLDLHKGSLLCEPGDPIEQIYFPESCVISLMTLMKTGEAIENTMVGREGGFGLPAAAAPRQALGRAIVQIAGGCWRAPATAVHEIWKHSPALQRLVDRHMEALYGHAIQSVACNALHSVEARFCRWILNCHDRIDGDRVSLTQEFLADMLGVQRTTVTAVARTLQAQGLIHYRRGVVEIKDRAGLEAIVCECYPAVREVYDRLLPRGHAC
jgi:CRP-like cAMP-binding protein